MDRHVIGSGAAIVDALEALNRLSGETMTLFVTDTQGRLLGSLTDGDIRRSLLAGHSLSDPVASICHKDCLRLDGSPSDARLTAEARSKGIALLPVIDADGRIVSLLDLRLRRGLVPVEAVIMAGGAGERLRPLTATCPKPLLPVGGKPIIDHNIELLRSFGISRIFVTVNYLKEQIAAHLEGMDGVEVIEEPRRLGTMGSLSLLPSTGATPHLLVMNADLLTDIDIQAMYLRHLETDAWLTMAAVPYSVAVPFAIAELEGDRVTGLTEKPTFNYYANAGIYLLRREAAERIPKGEFTDAPDFIDSLIKEGRRVTLFPIEGRWLDIGSPDDYRLACEIKPPGAFDC